MKDRVFIVSVASVTILCAGGVVYTQIPAVQPFIAQRTDVAVARRADGERNFGNTRTVAVRRDGSVSETVQDSATGAPARVQIIHNASSGEQVITDERTKTKTTWYLSKDAMDKRTIHPVSSCKGSAAGKMLEYDVYLDEVDEQIGDVKSHKKSWLAPVLNCFPLRYEVVNESNGGVFSETRVVTSVALEEPPTALFDVDPSYVETPPSAYKQELNRLFPDKFPAAHPSVNGDSAYWASRRHRLP